MSVYNNTQTNQTNQITKMTNMDIAKETLLSMAFVILSMAIYATIVRGIFSLTGSISFSIPTRFITKITILTGAIGIPFGILGCIANTKMNEIEHLENEKDLVELTPPKLPYHQKA